METAESLLSALLGPPAMIPPTAAWLVGERSFRAKQRTCAARFRG